MLDDKCPALSVITELLARTRPLSDVSHSIKVGHARYDRSIVL